MLYYDSPLILPVLFSIISAIFCIVLAREVLFPTSKWEREKQNRRVFRLVGQTLISLALTTGVTIYHSAYAWTEEERPLTGNEIASLRSFLRGEPVVNIWWADTTFPNWPKTLEKLGLPCDKKTLEVLSINPKYGGSKVKEYFEIKPAEYRLKID